MPAAKNFIFVCGQDDYLVNRLGQERFAALAADVPDEFSQEIISGFSANVDEVAAAVNRFREAVQTISLFGSRRAVWLKDVNFLADTQTGKAEGTLRIVEDLQQILETVKFEEVGVLISAAPVDRRRTFPKWCEKNADFVLTGGEGAEALAPVAVAEARSLDADFAPGALELLLARVGDNARLLIEEVRKLASFSPAAGGKILIEEVHVAELTPNTAEGDFFESAEAFFSGDLQWTLAAMRRHFFGGGDARPLIAAFQNRNRILLQLRALLDAGEARIGPRGVEGLSRAAESRAPSFGEAAGDKSSFNLFSQNPWYLGKLASGAKLPSLRRLVDNQMEFVATFEEIVRRPKEQEEVLRDLAVRCLAA